MSCGCKHDKKTECTGCICDEFKKLTTGTRIQIIFGDDNFFQDDEEDVITFTFACFDPETCCVTLRNGQTDDIFITDCRRIVGLKIVTID